MSSNPEVIGRRRKSSARPEVDHRMPLSPVTLVALVLIGLQLLTRAVVVLPSYFWQDDFVHLNLAKKFGLSQDFLVRDYSGHVEIGQYFLYWLIGHDIGTAFWPAALSIILLQLVASVLLFLVLRALFGDTAILLVPFTVYLFSPLALAAATWWAAALQTLPLQATMLLTILSLTRLHQTGAVKWGLVSVLAQITGLLFWEKAALILPCSVAVIALITLRDDSWKTRMHEFRRHWVWWGVNLLVLLAYVGFYFSITDGTQTSGSDRPNVFGAITNIVVRIFVPGLFGGPWHVEGAENTLYPLSGNLLTTFFLLLAAGVVVVSIAVTGKNAIWAWALLAAYITADLALVLIARFDYLSLVNRDPRYITDALPVVAIAVTAAFAGLAKSARDEPAGVFRALVSLPIIIAATAMITASCLLTTFLLAPTLTHEYTRNFTKGVVRQINEHPGVPLVNTELPGRVSLQADYDSLLRGVGEERAFDQPAQELFMFDSLANLRRVDVVSPTIDKTGPVSDCGWSTHQSRVKIGDVPKSTVKGQVVRLGYFADDSARLHILVGDREQSLIIRPGLGRAYFVFDGDSGPLKVWASDNTRGICISDVKVGRPWPESE